MKAPLFNSDGEKLKEIEIPKCFETVVRADLIHKVFWVLQKNQIQPYGAYPLAGKEVAASGKQSHARRKWKTLYGKGISRIPRKTLSRRGEQFYWIGAFIPGTVGGREAHPPKAVKTKLKINKKEKQKALESAIAACASKTILEKKYPSIEIKSLPDLPIIVNSDILNKPNKEIIKIIKKILPCEFVKRKIRAGKGKLRGRKYKISKRVLFIIGKEEKKPRLENYGIDVATINNLNIMMLAPGGVPGRITIWTEKAIEELKDKFGTKK